MPVRSLNSSVMRWPDRAAVRQAVAAWAAALAEERPDVRAVGYFGSLARERGWGVGSDADLLVLVDVAPEPFERRAATFDTSRLPVPADLLVYELAEWDALSDAGPFHDRMRREARWVYRRDDAAVRTEEAGVS